MIRRGLIVGLLVVLLLVLGFWLGRQFPSRQPAPPAKPVPPAVVSPGTLQETKINTITLSPAAIEKLGLKTAPVERKEIQRTRQYGAIVAVPPGQAVSVSAPVSGTVQPAAEGSPRPGQTVRKGEALLLLQPLLSPEAQVNVALARTEAQGQVNVAQSQLEAAEVALDRAKRLLTGGTGSQRAVDEVQAAFDIAQRTLAAARARLAGLGQTTTAPADAPSEPLVVRSPEDGIIQSLSVRSGQVVPAGSPLLGIVDLRRVWVRVPVYVGDLAELDRDADAMIGPLTERVALLCCPAKRAIAPPSADPVAGTVDLFYEMDNRAANYSPGQRVSAILPLTSRGHDLTVPWAAVIQDLYGGQWVYVQTGERTFERRMVRVQAVVGSTAILLSGPAEGVKAVTAGVAELFGTETGFSK